MTYSILCAAAATTVRPIDRVCNDNFVRRFSAPTTIYLYVCFLAITNIIELIAPLSVVVVVVGHLCCLVFFPLLLPFHSIQVQICLMMIFFSFNFSPTKSHSITALCASCLIHINTVFVIKPAKTHECTSNAKKSAYFQSQIESNVQTKILNNNDTLHWRITNSR